MNRVLKDFVLATARVRDLVGFRRVVYQDNNLDFVDLAIDFSD